MTNDYGTGISKLSEVRVDTILRGVLDVGMEQGEPTVLGHIYDTWFFCDDGERVRTWRG